MSIQRIVYSASVIDVFCHELGRNPGLETGGVLLGVVQGDRIVVERASGPGPGAIHQETYFRADKHFIDMFIDMEYGNAEGKIGYLGEWHTHPQVSPWPSDVDLNSLEEISESSHKMSVLLILGASEFSRENFISQSISIIKYPGITQFYRIDVEILES